MEGYPNSSHLVEALRPEAQESKKRKVLQKTVVTVKVEPNDEKRRSDGPPSDYWSWRKYGQKPIKGSPYPRGYYRCSTSKGCSAKKQVERSGTDASVLIITYTSTHNHPDPDFSTNSLCLTLKQSKEQIIPKSTEGISTPAPQNSEQEQQPRTIPTDEDQFQFVSSSQDALPFAEKAGDPTAVIVPFDGEPLHRPHQKNLPSEENDFFDELEELPTSSPFTRSSFFDERSLVQQQKQSS